MWWIVGGGSIGRFFVLSAETKKSFLSVTQSTLHKQTPIKKTSRGMTQEA
jgi:hypothetical protein